MSLARCVRYGALTAVLLLGPVAAAPPAQAGILDFLFGGGSFGPAPGRSSDSPGMDVRVNPRKKSGKPNVVSATGSERRPLLAKSIDPVRHPNWYLEDPTLRRGDIVVLKGQVLVFDGGAGGQATPASFTQLNRSPLVSRGEKTRLEQMADTSGPAVPLTRAAN